MDEDVKESVGTDVPSSGDETAVQETTQEAGASTPVEDLESKTVPYSRLKEAIEKGNERVERLERQLQERATRETAAATPQQPANPEQEQIRSALGQLGYKPIDEVRAEIQQTLAQERANIRVEQQLSGLEGKFDGKNGLPRFDRAQVVKYALDKGIGDPEIAYEQLHKREVLDWHIKQAIAKSSGTKSEASDGSGSEQAGGTANSDLKAAAMQGDTNALHTFLKRII